MSVHHESAEIGKASERTEAAPELAYRTVTQDSLSMFLAAIGGAVLGMLLTLLVLALINGGTLSYAGARLEQVETRLQQVDENVGAVSANINIVSEQAAAIQQQLGAVETSLRNEIETQSGDLVALNESVATLNQTREQFDIFVGALASALTEMGALDSPADEEPTEPAASETAPTVAAPEATPAASEPLGAAESVTDTTSLTATTPVTVTTDLTGTEMVSETDSLTATDGLTETTSVTATDELTE